MTPAQQKTGMAVVLLVLAAVLVAIWLRQSAQSIPELSPPALQSAANPAASPPNTGMTEGAVVPATPASAPDDTGAMVRPEDAIVPEPDDGHSDEEDAPVGKPSQKVIDAIREARKPAPDEGRVTVNPDGSQTLNLGNRYLSAPVATVDKDGKVHVDYHGEKYVQDAGEKNDRK